MDTRESLHTGLSALGAAVGYFALTDFVRPSLEAKHIAAWWLILGLYVGLLFVLGFWSILRTKPGMVIAGFLLLTATVYLYDPAIESRLALNGLGWLWIISLAGFFVWILAFGKGVRKREQQKT